ncbi:MAG: ATP-binding protein, partial [Myxococcota bacterium]
QMLLERMLAPEPFERIQSCAEVRHALRRWYSQERPGLTAVHLPWSGGAPWSRSKVSNRVEAARTQAEINLLPWRAAPLVGRDIEQVQLWRMFEEVGEDDAPQAVLVYGETGMGKTRLVSWLAESLVEVGQAHELRINLGPLTWEEGIRVALEREFHTTSLDDEAFGRRLRKAVALLEHQSTGRPMAGPEHGQQGVTETALYGQHLQAVAALLRPGVSLDDSEHSSRLEHYRSELIKRPNDLALRQRYAELLYGQGLKPEALSHYLNLAGAYRSRSMFFELNRVCRTILEIDPSNAKAQAYLNAVPAEVFQPNNVVHSEVRSATPRTPMPLALAESSGGGDPLADEGFVSSGSTMVTRMDSFARLSTLYGEHMGTLASILTRMSSSKPLVVVVDNVRASHWEEVISFLWTLHCMSLSRALPVLVVMTSLDRIPTLGWIPSTATVVSQLREGSKLQEMALSPLDEPAVEAIMDPYRTLGHDRRQRIQQVACGNPLFATSLANQMLMDALNPPDPHEEEDNVSVFEGSGRGVEQIEDLWLYRVHLLSRRSGLDTHAMLFLELLCCLDEPLEMALALRAWCAPEMRLIHRLASSRTAQVG